MGFRGAKKEKAPDTTHDASATSRRRNANGSPFEPVIVFDRQQEREGQDETEHVLVVHAADDEMVPIAVARTLFGRIADPKLMIETDGGHNDAGFGRGTRLNDALNRFWPLK